MEMGSRSAGHVAAWLAASDEVPGGCRGLGDDPNVDDVHRRCLIDGQADERVSTSIRSSAASRFLQADPAAPGGLVRQVRRKRRAILKVGEVIDVDQRGDLAGDAHDRHRAMASPRLSHKFGQLCLSRSQRIGHAFDRNTGQ